MTPRLRRCRAWGTLGHVTELPDDTLAIIADELRQAVGADEVGDFIEVLDDGPGLHGVQFASRGAGYVGWRWTVQVAEFDGRHTVNDIVLLPGPESIVAPAWTPYKDRVQPEDLGPGDVLPPDADDVRLVPAWSAGDGSGGGVVDRHFAREIGLGREWVLSLEGREDAADRWYDGGTGPESPIAQQSSGRCGTCGFLVSLAGNLSDRFGVCANRMSRADGQVVALRYGCGAHSGTGPKRSSSTAVLPTPMYDTLSVDVYEREPSVPVPPEAPVSPESPVSPGDSVSPDDD